MRTFAILCIATLLVVNGDCKDKRGTDDYTNASTVKPITENSQPTYTGTKFNSPPYVSPSKAGAYTANPQQLNFVVQPTYKFASQPALQQPQIPTYKFVSPQAAPQAQISYVPQQQYDFGQQNVAYAPPTFPKSAPAIQKFAYTPIQAPTPAKIPAPAAIQYSSAGDVSSFKYSSPLVSYSNLGVISQSAGKLASTGPTRIYAEQPQQQQQLHQQQQLQQQQYPQETQSAALQQILYKPRLQIPQIQYQPAPQVVPKYVYSQVPQLTFTNVPQNQPQPAVTQKLSASVPQQFVYNRPQQFVYTPVQPTAYSAQPAQTQPAHSIPQPAYVIAPQYQAQGVAYQQQ